MKKNKIKLLIVDDEPLAHKVLEKYCQSIEYVEVVGNCYDGVSAINFLNENEIEVLLLDIQMPDLTGLELLETLQKKSLKVIFTTAYTDYALQSFEYEQVIDYLHKPIRLSRFLKSMERLKKQVQMERDIVEKGNIIKSVEPKKSERKENKKLEYIYVKDNKITYKIELEKTLYLQAWGNYVKFFSDDNEVKIARNTMKEIEELLTESNFERIHKSYLVNTDKIKMIDGNQVILLDDTVLPIGKSYAIVAKRNIINNK